MATTFLEPGGDATGNLAITTAGGFWRNITGTPTIVTDFVHGTHQNSLKAAGAGASTHFDTPNGAIADAGTRISFYLYIVTQAGGGNSSDLLQIDTASGGAIIVKLGFPNLSTTLTLFNGSGTSLGSGPALGTGKWHRISIAYTITSTTVNSFNVWVDGVSAITVSNTTLGTTISSEAVFGVPGGNPTSDFRFSDIYIDNSASLTDPGNIWVTAKRPFSNGTTNGFTTQIGSGGSGYGSGHAQQVNERPLSTTNGWSMVGAGSAITEEYSIETANQGDIGIPTGSIVDFMGWAYASSLSSETASLILAGNTSNISLTSTNTMFTKAAGSTTYPVGGTDIGLTTTTALTTVSLYETGIMFAFTQSTSTENLPLLGVG